MDKTTATLDVSPAKRALITRTLVSLFASDSELLVSEASGAHFLSTISDSQRKLLTYCFGSIPPAHQLIQIVDSLLRYVIAVIAGAHSRAECFGFLNRCNSDLGEELRILAVRCNLSETSPAIPWLLCANKLKAAIFGFDNTSPSIQNYWRVLYEKQTTFTPATLIRCAQDVSKQLLSDDTGRVEQLAVIDQHNSQIHKRIAALKTISSTPSFISDLTHEKLISLANESYTWRSVTLSPAFKLEPNANLTCAISKTKITDANHLIVHIMELEKTRVAFITAYAVSVPTRTTIFAQNAAHSLSTNFMLADFALTLPDEDDEDVVEVHDLTALGKSEKDDRKKLRRQNELDEAEPNSLDDFIVNSEDDDDDDELSEPLVTLDDIPSAKFQRLRKSCAMEQHEDYLSGSDTEERPPKFTRKQKKQSSTTKRNDRANNKNHKKRKVAAEEHDCEIVMPPATKKLFQPSVVVYRLTPKHVTPNSTLIHAIAVHVIGQFDLMPAMPILQQWQTLTLDAATTFVDTMCASLQASWHELAAFLVAISCNDPSDSDPTVLVLSLDHLGLHCANIQMQIMIEWLHTRMSSLPEAEITKLTDEMHNVWVRNTAVTPRAIKTAAKALQDSPILSLFVRLMFSGHTI